MAWKISGGSAGQSTTAAAWQQRQQNFQVLGQALKSNSLSTAQAAFASLTANAPAKALTNPNSPLAQLAKALQSGDLTGAQQAFASLRSNGTGSGTTPALSNAATPPLPKPTLLSGNSVNTYV